MKNSFIVFGIMIGCLSSSAFAVVPKATVCRADAILAAAFIFKISDPAGSSQEADIEGNPRVVLKERRGDQSEVWSIVWKGLNKSAISYTVDVTPTITNGVQYACFINSVVVDQVQ